MASKKASNDAPNTVKDGERIVQVDLKDIYPDFQWNCRKNVGKDSSGGKEDESSFFDLKESLLAKGQNDAMVVRPKRRSKSQYDLVCGFRRYAAAQDIYEKGGNIPGLDNGKVKVVIRELNDKEARILNGLENTARENLNAPDTAFLVGELAKDGLTDNEIGHALGKSFGYVGKLHRIHAATSVVMFSPWPDKPAMSIFDYWRQFPAHATVDALDKMQKNVQEDMRADAFLALIKPPAKTEPDPIGKIATEGGKIAALLTTLHKAGAIRAPSGEWDWIAILEAARPKMAKKLDNQQKRNRVAKSMNEASEKVLLEGDSDDTEGEDETDEQTNPRRAVAAAQ